MDIEDGQKISKFVKIKNVSDSGIIIYRLDNKNFYVGKGLYHIHKIKDIFEQIKNKKLNWHLKV